MTLNKIPERSKAIVLRKAEDQGSLYKFDAALEDRDVPPLKNGQVLVKIEAAGFNHREVSLGCALFYATVVNLCRFGSGKVCTRA
jgi:D-arabinose 1-dehydrogenase-like Zn-dependent alcohol dehydrogenase